MARWPQWMLIVTTLVASWLGMQAVHEFGHVCGAWATGGRVARVVLHPLTISRTDLAENPRPLVVTRAGPVLGVVLPLAAWGIAVASRCPVAFLLRFFAGFCLVANGLYIGVGSLFRVGDCGDLLSHGAAIWELWLFGVATSPLGFWLWNGQGNHFGLGSARGQVDPRAAWWSLVSCGVLVVMGLLVGK